ncbi:hypothetical protein [Qipengyuania soli]|uniref:Uncharacterized protein n=1 Tax=Qipengyuania soli TaxID=2782568 RepID=A0A7S8F6F1_9SPHN|nr:hypothetical protein [Qipengyuania soli]QPC99853.1 hypothetical protein IRL76_04755 [Qipengyuania soli]
MRAILAFSALAMLAVPAFAAQEPADQHAEATHDAHPAPRTCTPAQTVVPPFNNTPEAMEQSRVAATILRGDEICKTSALFPEKSVIEHGEEQPVLPEEAADEPAEEPAPEQPA